ncbi:MAG: hypothetical protein O3A13_05180 [Proteobacteria bacterium]|nr:hypothetical protein [Pseudomonadota bacterium]
MADLNNPKTKPKWQQHDQEDPLGFDMDDDELFFDEEEIDEDLIEQAEDIPSWRRIEMAREEQFLKEAMADFEDYDEFGDLGRGLSAEFSH